MPESTMFLGEVPLAPYGLRPATTDEEFTKEQVDRPLEVRRTRFDGPGRNPLIRPTIERADVT